MPKEIKSVLKKLETAGFEAYLVGGCVRDLLLKIEPKDWDITTNAKPQEIRSVFPNSFYENKFLTVTVKTNSEDPRLKEVEVTTYRSEAKYTDRRHPDKIKFAKTLEEDLQRRDFTINAMALTIKKEKLVDLFEGKKDLENKIIRAVGDPKKRFNEDSLRMMRAVRLATTLDFTIEEKTAQEIKKNSSWLSFISKERVRDEFLKIIISERAAKGIELLRNLNLLKHIIPELEESYGVTQNKHHIYDVYTHSLRALDYAAKKNFNKYIRIAALLHDIAKPRVKKGEGPDATFYNHEIVGAEMTKKILNRLKFPKKDIEKITKLVRYHLFYYNVGEVGESSVRRLVRRVGIENMDDLLKLRMADRIGSGVPKAEPYKLRHLKYLIEKVSRDPLSVKMLKVSGNDVMRILKITPGPKIGLILDILLGLVLSDPNKNKKTLLEKEIKKLGSLPDDKIKRIAEEAKRKRNEIETKKDQMTKKKYWVT
ncbi:MAG TPA: HD domain-containing protein [Candidatus Parcubacteria bacterium]|nr:HD domain-containing protein [Candidatus Parcubacteria bacterium]